MYIQCMQVHSKQTRRSMNATIDNSEDRDWKRRILDYDATNSSILISLILRNKTYYFISETVVRFIIRRNTKFLKIVSFSPTVFPQPLIEKTTVILHIGTQGWCMCLSEYSSPPPPPLCTVVTK